MAISSWPKKSFWKPSEPGLMTPATDGVMRPGKKEFLLSPTCQDAHAPLSLSKNPCAKYIATGSRCSILWRKDCARPLDLQENRKHLECISINQSMNNGFRLAELTTKKVKIEHPLHWQGLEVVE
jgi:hypothetical protein